MDETSGTVLHDSTVNANDAVKKSTGAPSPTAAGKLGGAQRFTGTPNSTNNDYALFGSPTAPTDNFTIEYWTNATSYVNQDSVFLESSGTPTTPVVYTGFFWYPSGTVLFRNSYNGTTPSSPAAATTGVFHNIVFARSGNTMNVYLDGVPGTAASGFLDRTDSWKGFGWDGGASSVFDSFNGILDEVFLSNVPRSADYITARYNNVSSPSTFYTVAPFAPLTPIPLSTTQADSQVNVF
jgi:hypothetical protein